MAPREPLSRRDALLLLPYAPATASVLDASREWLAAVDSWGIARDGSGGGELCVTDRAEVALRCQAPLVLSTGRGVGDVLGRNGYHVVRYRVLAGADRTAVVVQGRRPSWRRQATHLRQTRRGPSLLTVARSSGSPAPGLLVAAGADASAAFRLVVARGDLRRRAVFLPDGDPERRLVVKASRAPDDGSRGQREQEVLRRLAAHGLVEHVPRPLGSGRCGPVQWSCETAVPGAPWALQRMSGDAARTLLATVAAWLAELAGATTGGPWWPPDAPQPDLGLRAPHDRHGITAADLAGVPSVLAHGDLGSARNILVDGPSFAVVDWETASDRGLPLQDLLPLACGVLSRARGAADVDSEASYTLRLLSGLEPDSEHLFTWVRASLRACGAPLRAAGCVAALVWSRQASMRLVHQELLAGKGLPVTPWRAAAETVAARWAATPGLGREWSAFHRWLRGGAAAGAGR